MIKSRFNRGVLAEILLDLQKDVSGEARQNLYQLYMSLGLHQDAYSKLKSWRWEVVSQGILELTQMRVEDSYLFIRRFINHSRGVIRKQAQIATVSLKNEGINYFMDTCRYQISEWQQLKLIDVLRHLEDFTPPRFKVWLTSKNKDIVLFALRLIRYYNQNDANPAIIQLIKHRNAQIRSEAIQCLKDFGVSEALDTLKSAFRRSQADVKLSILDAIGSLGGKQEIDFLRKVEKTEQNFTVKSKALTTINTLDPDSIMPIEDIREPSRSDLEFAKLSTDSSQHSIQTKLQFDPMPTDKEEQNDLSYSAENEEEIIHSDEPGLEEHDMPTPEPGTKEENISPYYSGDENETIFDICFREELKDIMDEAWPEHEPQYLSLSFLPMVEGVEGDVANVQAGKDLPKEQDPQTKPILDEDKFRHHLDAILNKIAMTNNQNRKKNNDEIPKFLPLVVDESTGDENYDKSTETLMDMEVIAELIYGDQDLFVSIPSEEETASDSAIHSLMETEVVSELIEPEENNYQEESSISRDSLESEESQENEEELGAFSIFHEMFRDFDTESKLILLDEILVVGEEKELRFLKKLGSDPDKRIRKKALKIRKLLEDKLRKEQQIVAEVNIAKGSAVIEKEAEMEAVAPEKEERPQEIAATTQKLPLEYCFYHPEDSNEDFAEDVEPQFDLEPDDIVEEQNELNDHRSNDDTESDKFYSFIENLFSITVKTRDKKNG